MRTSERAVAIMAACGLVLGAGAFLRGLGGTAVAGGGWSATAMATCDVYKAADLLMKSDRFAQVILVEQQATETRLKSMEPLEKELLDMQNRLAAFSPDTKDPAAKTLAEQFQKRRDEYLQQRQRITDAFENFTAMKNFEAYSLVVETARTIAGRRGLSHVFATRLVDDGKPPETGLGFTMRLLARPVVVGPEADDITAELLRELKVDQPGGIAPAPGR
ncbi:MAG: hypothetical protein ACT4PL_08545 [Phycisphaerales bacterium]